MGNDLSGLIGISGKIYPCKTAYHSVIALKYASDAPFVVMRTHYGDFNAEFVPYAEVEKPTDAQRKALEKICDSLQISITEATEPWDHYWED